MVLLEVSDEVVNCGERGPLVETSLRTRGARIPAADLHARGDAPRDGGPARHLLKAKLRRGYENLVGELKERAVRELGRPDVAAQPPRAYASLRGRDEDMQRTRGGGLDAGGREVDPGEARGIRKRPSPVGRRDAGSFQAVGKANLRPARK